MQVSVVTAEQFVSSYVDLTVLCVFHKVFRFTMVNLWYQLFSGVGCGSFVPSETYSIMVNYIGLVLTILFAGFQLNLTC